MNVEQNTVEKLARAAFLHYHGYSAPPEDWDKLPKTQQKWKDMVQFLLKELSFDNKQQLS